MRCWRSSSAPRRRVTAYRRPEVSGRGGVDPFVQRCSGDQRPRIQRAQSRAVSSTTTPLKTTSLRKCALGDAAETRRRTGQSTVEQPAPVAQHPGESQEEEPHAGMATDEKSSFFTHWSAMTNAGVKVLSPPNCSTYDGRARPVPPSVCC